jgi:hypothetical protein
MRSECAPALRPHPPLHEASERLQELEAHRAIHHGDRADGARAVYHPRTTTPGQAVMPAKRHEACDAVGPRGNGPRGTSSWRQYIIAQRGCRRHHTASQPRTHRRRQVSLDANGGLRRGLRGGSLRQRWRARVAVRARSVRSACTPTPYPPGSKRWAGAAWGGQPRRWKRAQRVRHLRSWAMAARYGAKRVREQTPFQLRTTKSSSAEWHGQLGVRVRRKPCDGLNRGPSRT